MAWEHDQAVWVVVVGEHHRKGARNLTWSPQVGRCAGENRAALTWPLAASQSSTQNSLGTLGSYSESPEIEVPGDAG